MCSVRPRRDTRDAWPSEVPGRADLQSRGPSDRGPGPGLHQPNRASQIQRAGAARLPVQS